MIKGILKLIGIFLFIVTTLIVVVFNGKTILQENFAVDTIEEVQIQVEVKTRESEPQIPEGFYKVTKIVDGDTIKVEIDGEEETVRLIGIDTPETVHPSKPVQCFGIEASEKVKELLSDKIVRLEFDETQGEQDRYGRLLTYVFLENGTNLNELLIREGYAYEYTYESPYKYQELFKEVEVYAKNNKSGLWATGICE